MIIVRVGGVTKVRRSYARNQSVSVGEFAFQMLRGSQALQTTVHHNCQPGAQHFTLLHTRGRGLELRRGPAECGGNVGLEREEEW